MVWRERRHYHRQAMIDACRLIGYTIQPASDEYGPYTEERYRYIVLNRVGNVLRYREPRNSGFMGYVRTFRFMWEAAEAALIEENVDVRAFGPVRADGEGGCATRSVSGRGYRHQAADYRTAQPAPVGKRD